MFRQASPIPQWPMSPSRPQQELIPWRISGFRPPLVLAPASSSEVPPIVTVQAGTSSEPVSVTEHGGTAVPPVESKPVGGSSESGSPLLGQQGGTVSPVGEPGASGAPGQGVVAG